MGKSEAEQWVFESFALGHPHEAAEMDWPRFVAVVHKVSPDMTEQEIRDTLLDGVQHQEAPRV